jgi:hypothetical protein
MTYRELAGIVGVECRDPDKGEKCFTAPDDPHGGDYWDVELLPDCGEHGFFGGVVEPSGATIVDKVPPEDTVRRATLSKGQIVCIQAIARAGQQPMYLYVVALPAASIAACKDNPLCEMYGDRQVTWHAPHGDANCRMVANGRFEGACAAGWIYDKELEGFSEGM